MHNESRLPHYLREIEAALSYEYAIPPANVIGRWHRMLVDIDDLTNIVETLCGSSLQGWRSSISSVLSGGLLRTDEIKHSRARDTQFELVLATMLARAGYHPRLEEPDLVVEIRGREIGIAAKRPRSRPKLQHVAKRAGHQIVRSNIPGIVAMDATIVANPEDKHLTEDGRVDISSFMRREAVGAWRTYRSDSR